MVGLPRAPGFDSTLALLAEGYGFITRRCDRLQSDVFETRLMLQKTICLHGADAAELFYDETRFRRSDAAPRRLRRTLLGARGVQTMDGARHRQRKRMLMSLLDEDRLQELADLTSEEWLAAIDRWQGQERVVLLPALEELLCRAVCRWAGVPLSEADVAQRTADLHAMVDGAGAIGSGHLRARRARKRAERWIGQLIAQVRSGALSADRESALCVIARHRDLSGELLDLEAAAVELLNVLRPTVAVAYFIAFAALALHEHPESRRALASGEAQALEWFVHEVRRFYPFVPFAVARVREDFDWRGFRFRKGRRALLDLYGTDHDPRLWDEPGAFRPERFKHRKPGAFTFIPQGGGDPNEQHRCAGERVTIELMKLSVAFLANGMSYRVPAQDLTIDLGRMPARPRSGFAIEGVRPPETRVVVPVRPEAIPSERPADSDGGGASWT